ncbi:MAG: LacI family DNA-binding transcriptional regulator [Alphaproteobacteria bacterium]|nr:LacI family DNA-binding transcriptional regulator [Alphaproteobacteria bacterium]
MRRVSIAEIMRETGLSRATVDRALNGRGRVHARTREAIEHSIRKLQSPRGLAAQNGPKADIVLRLGRGMMSEMRAAWEGQKPDGTFHDLYQAQEAQTLEVVGKLCADASRPLILTVKNSDRLSDVLVAARRRGKRIITMISDVAREARDHFVGIDNRAAGQTAAFLIGRALGDRPSSVGVVVGDIAFRGHEDREIGFRTALRAHFPRIVLAGEAQGEDHQDLTQQAVAKMIDQHPGLAAIYNVGGGNKGLANALQAAGLSRHVIVVGHEVNYITAALLKDASMDYAIAASPAAQLAEALRVAHAPEASATRDSSLLDFGVYTRFNLPAFHTPEAPQKG